MIADFESRFADTLGALLPPPFAGRVNVAGSELTGSPNIVVGVASVEELPLQMGDSLTEIVPGSSLPRRIVRLSCEVTVEVLSEAGRSQQLTGLDAALYALTDPDFLSALPGDAPDPGFLIRNLAFTNATTLPEDNQAPSLRLRADGWFWPPGEVGEAGIEIAEIRVRSGVLPLVVLPAQPRLAPGGPPQEFTLRLNTNAMLITSDDTQPLEPFGPLTLRLRDSGNRPGAGTLTGGAAGPDDSRLVTLTDGEGTISYTPPAEAATDFLVVSLETGEHGVTLGRVRLEVR